VNKAVEQKTRVLQPYLLRVMALMQEGHYDEAEKDARPLIDDFPYPIERGVIFRALALAKFDEKHYTDAHSLAKKSLKYDPTSEEAIFLLGASQIVTKRVDDGLNEVQSYVHAKPQLASNYEALGRVEGLAGRYNEAEHAFMKALEIDPKLVTSQLFLSDTDQKRGKLDEAMAELSAVAQARPDLAEVPIRMGQLAELKEDWSAAKIYYSRALKLAPDSAIAKNNLAWVYAEHGGDIDVALRLAQEAEESVPGNLDYSDTLAWILVKHHSYDTAIRLLQECVQKDPDNGWYSYHLGVAYYSAGEKTQAEQFLHMTLKLQPGFPEAGKVKKLLATLRN
jgi:tetratricopeptide (TPR) repeat protein